VVTIKPKKGVVVVGIGIIRGVILMKGIDEWFQWFMRMEQWVRLMDFHWE